MAADRSETVAQSLRSGMDRLTPSERQLAGALLANYPVAGLTSITNLADAASVSTPTVVRMARKLGFPGFPEFQDALRRELEATLSGPIAKHDRWARDAPETHILNRFADAVMDNMHRTINQVDPDAFDRACKLLADRNRSVYLVGGRITYALARYFFTHLQVIRERVALLSASASLWPHDLINMKRGDLLIVYDIRRYETDLERLAGLAKERGVEVILFTDQWMSPIAGDAAHAFSASVEAPSGWDSTAGLLFLTETMISAVEKLRWKEASKRMQTLEVVFDSTQQFRKR